MLKKLNPKKKQRIRDIADIELRKKVMRKVERQAFELYMEFDEEDFTHKYPARVISKVLNEKNEYTISGPAIRQWVFRKRWNDIFSAAKEVALGGEFKDNDEVDKTKQIRAFTDEVARLKINHKYVKDLNIENSGWESLKKGALYNTARVLEAQLVKALVANEALFKAFTKNPLASANKTLTVYEMWQMASEHLLKLIRPDNKSGNNYIIQTNGVSPLRLEQTKPSTPILDALPEDIRKAVKELITQEADSVRDLPGPGQIPRSFKDAEVIVPIDQGQDNKGEQQN